MLNVQISEIEDKWLFVIGSFLSVTIWDWYQTPKNKYLSMSTVTRIYMVY